MYIHCVCSLLLSVSITLGLLVRCSWFNHSNRKNRTKTEVKYWCLLVYDVWLDVTEVSVESNFITSYKNKSEVNHPKVYTPVHSVVYDISHGIAFQKIVKPYHTIWHSFEKLYEWYQDIKCNLHTSTSFR